MMICLIWSLQLKNKLVKEDMISLEELQHNPTRCWGMPNT